jgi:hypothetical protein
VKSTSLYACRMALTMVGLLALAVGFLGAETTTIDNQIYAGLLARHVRHGVVDYRGLKQEEPQLDRYLDVLSKVAPGSLTAAARFAFYVNAYNAWTLKLILEHYPGITSIKDAGSLWRSPWKKKIARIDGRLLTLDEIEHGILRTQFKEPRVHFAVNCASKGCPPLYGVPFNGRDLDRQLDFVTRSFINDPSRYRLEDDVLYVSRIFKWFPEDFNHDPIGFFRTYAEGGLKVELQKRAQHLRVKYLDYDWSLNGD